MTKLQFFEAFVAAVRAQGDTAVVTDNDLHHASFAEALKLLKTARESGSAELEALPRGLVGDEITGRFPELDSALARLQFDRYVGASNPHYRRVQLTLDPQTAEGILALYTPSQRDVIRDMARVFASSGAAVSN